MGIGISSTGLALPETVRGNDFWSPETVDGWRSMFEMQSDEEFAEIDASHQRQFSEGLRERQELFDPFNGAKERRIADPNTVSSDLEVLAATKAIEAAPKGTGDFDALICSTAVPDKMAVTNASKVHDLLSLPRKCLSFNLDAAANSFLHQLEVSRSLISSGRCRRVLTIQSSLMSRLANIERPWGTWHGDGATAAIVEDVGDGHGILGAAHYTDGRYYDAAFATTDGGSWFDTGRVTWRLGDRQVARALMFNVTEFARSSVSEALREAGLSVDEVAFFGLHQGTAWMQEECQRAVGLSHAKTMHNYSWTGSLSSADVPLMYHLSREQGLLRDGEAAVFFSGGSGITYSSTVLRAGTRLAS
ncbi:MAG: 3-oxoacyl-[acyl-carrier-protein] synthase III C-terminal domain-containing protein [Myxococcota bacterium]